MKALEGAGLLGFPIGICEHRRSCRKGKFHCLSEASLKFYGSFEERKKSKGPNATGVVFWFIFWTSKK
ncbi:MAG: hypothetical protein SCH71_07215 [Desulfobulbaceae bacterium]|nr:hypothetical protein [Desulfobulbaceae bacterium]